jgi:hypothetical protein
MYQRKTPITVFFVGFVAIVLILSVIGFYQLGTVGSVIFKVTDKNIKTSSDGDGNVSSKYLIFTDKGVFENTDAVFHAKWNSSDVYSQLSVGKSFKCKVYGFRVPLLSWYKNIVSCSNISGRFETK